MLNTHILQYKMLPHIPPQNAHAKVQEVREERLSSIFSGSPVTVREAEWLKQPNYGENGKADKHREKNVNIRGKT